MARTLVDQFNTHWANVSVTFGGQSGDHMLVEALLRQVLEELVAKRPGVILGTPGAIELRAGAVENIWTTTSLAVGDEVMKMLQGEGNGPLGAARNLLGQIDGLLYTSLEPVGMVPRTVYDQIRANAGLIHSLGERSTVMNNHVSIEFEGNLQGLIEFLEGTFKDPGKITLKVTASFGERARTPMEKLAGKVARALHTTPEVLLKGCPEYPRGLEEAVRLSPSNKIAAIKCLRTLTNAGLKDAKEAIEQIVDPAIATKEIVIE